MGMQPVQLRGGLTMTCVSPEPVEFVIIVNVSSRRPTFHRVSPGFEGVSPADSDVDSILVDIEDEHMLLKLSVLVVPYLPSPPDRLVIS